jgi:hypothetical protein
LSAESRSDIDENTNIHLRFEGNAGLIVCIELRIGASRTTVGADDDEEQKCRVGGDAENDPSTGQRASRSENVLCSEYRSPSSACMIENEIRIYVEREYHPIGQQGDNWVQDKSNEK